MIDRRDYLEAVSGTVLAVSAGCLGDGGQTGASATTTEETTSEIEQTPTRTTEQTSTRTTETESFQSIPSVAFSFEYSNGDETAEVAITHEGGDSLDGKRVTVTIDGTVAFEGGSVAASNYHEVTNEWQGTVATGDELAVRDGRETAITEYQTIEIEWTPEDGDDAVLVAQSRVRF